MRSAKKVVVGLFMVASVLGFVLITKAASPNNSTPILFSPDPASTLVVAGNPMSFLLVGFDPDTADVLTYSAANLPTGATLNSTTGLFNWVPTTAQIGSYNVDFTVSDGIDSNTISATLVVTQPVVTPPTTTPHDDHEERRNRRREHREERSSSRK